MDLAELLKQYVRAMSDPTRGAILLELGVVGELTATQLAKRLGLTANNVYHHMRTLRGMEVLNPPRAVPGETYVEKYYSLKPELLEAMRTPEWLDKVQEKMTSEERKALFIGNCLTMSQILQRAAKRYEVMDAEHLEGMLRGQSLGMLSINEMNRERLRNRLAALRKVLGEEQAEEQTTAGDDDLTDVVLMAGLPMLWDRER